MVQATFQHLPEKKQRLVRQALLHEFSQYPLAQAQVARIVKDAGIARGAFYTYFKDLTDAYQYLFEATLKDVHVVLPEEAVIEEPEQYVDTIRRFFNEASNLDFLALFQMHYRFNEGALGTHASKLVETEYGPQRWAVMTLYHQTIRDCIIDSDHLEARLHQLQVILEKSPLGGE